MIMIIIFLVMIVIIFAITKLLPMVALCWEPHAREETFNISQGAVVELRGGSRDQPHTRFVIPLLQIIYHIYIYV